MTTIVVSPTQAETGTTELVQLQILVEDSDWSGFDHCEVWRSMATAEGPYEEVTADTWLGARLPKDALDAPSTPVTGAYVAAGGMAMQLLVDDLYAVPILLSGTNPLTYAQVATQITAQGLNKVASYVDSTGEIVIETTAAGTGSMLLIVEGDAAAAVGLPTQEPDSLAYGRDARITLRRGTHEYLFNDLRGSSTYFYKTRFYNRTTRAHSEFSQPFGASQVSGLSPDSVCMGTIDLVSVNGKPLASRYVSVYNRFLGVLVENKLVAGREESKLTDANGHAEFVLVRGATVTVSISGTDIARDITVPVDIAVKTFSLLDPTITTGVDIFKAQVPTLVYAERRSL